MLRLLLTTTIAALILAAPATATSPRQALHKQLKSELAGQGQKACLLMSESYQQMFFDAAVMLGNYAADCPQAVNSLTSLRRENDRAFDAKAKRQLKAVKRGEVTISDNYATVNISFRGAAPGGAGGRGYKTDESYGLVASGDSWLVDAVLESKATKR